MGTPVCCVFPKKNIERGQSLRRYIGIDKDRSVPRPPCTIWPPHYSCFILFPCNPKSHGTRSNKSKALFRCCRGSEAYCEIRYAAPAYPRRHHNVSFKGVGSTHQIIEKDIRHDRWTKPSQNMSRTKVHDGQANSKQKAPRVVLQVLLHGLCEACRRSDCPGAQCSLNYGAAPAGAGRGCPEGDALFARRAPPTND